MTFSNIVDILIDFVLDIICDFIFEMVRIKLKYGVYLMLDMFGLNPKYFSNSSSLQEVVEIFCEFICVTPMLVVKEIFSLITISLYVQMYCLLSMITFRCFLFGHHSFDKIVNTINNTCSDALIEHEKFVSNFNATGFLGGFYLMQSIIDVFDPVFHI